MSVKEQFRRFLQRKVANILFPANSKDWYIIKGYGKDASGNKVANPFENFVNLQKGDTSSHYYKHFQELEFNRHMVKSQLITGRNCQLEVMTCTPNESELPGSGKHIIYVPGANTYYQACFRDITAAAKKTGATVHAFNFPGTGASTGRVLAANDLTNSCIAVVNDLIAKGVHPDDIILQGDCYGAAIASETKKEFQRQSGIKLRMIMNNSFKSFKAAIYDMVTSLWYIPSFLKPLIRKILIFTGWHVTPGKDYKHADPYQCHIQHLGDQTLKTSTLASKVQKYKDEIRSGETNSTKRAPVGDTCPESYKADRDRLDRMHLVRVKSAQKKRLKKWGADRYGRVNAHFADLCELEMLDGNDVYSGFVNEYILASDRYITDHHQDKVKLSDLPGFLSTWKKPVGSKESPELADDLLKKEKQVREVLSIVTSASETERRSRTAP